MAHPLQLAREACETMIRHFEAPMLKPVGHFHYHQGVFLSGMLKIWKLTGDDRYFDYARAWIDSVFDADGRIKNCTFSNLDDIQPGILLFPILDKTGDPYYRKCLDSVAEEVEAIRRNPEGGFWHAVNLTDQMWLDGLYMAGPFIAEYGARFGRPEWLRDAIHQALLMQKNTLDEKTGLLCHAWDGRREMPWCDPETGKSHEFWGRSMGWVPVALLDELRWIPEDMPGRQEVADMACSLLRHLIPFQGPDGRWFQVVNKGDQPGNWPENSCTSLYVAALCRAIRTGLLPADLTEVAVRGFEGVAASLEHDGNDLLIGQVCIGTGVGDYDFYCARPCSVNDLHGVGAFLLMCAELAELQAEA